MRRPLLKYSGFSLVELLVSISIFALILGSVAVFSLDSVRYSHNDRRRLTATAQLREFKNGVLIVKSSGWENIEVLTNTGPKHIDLINNRYEVIEGPKLVDEMEIFFEVLPVFRDSEGNLDNLNGQIDPYSRRVVLSASWSDFIDNPQVMESSLYINNWNLQLWSETMQSEFDLGVYDLALSTLNDDGEIQLSTVIYGDWCNPEITQTSFDMPGNGVAKTIFALPGQSIMGTGNNASGVSLINTFITDNDPPAVSVDGTFTGYKTNHIVTDGRYAFLATDTNSKEVVIVDMGVTPYQEVGFFNPTGNNSGKAVYVDGNYGYVIVSNRLHIFDISSKSGSRPQIAQMTLFNQGTFMRVKDGYAYILIAGATQELQIVNITNPASPQTAGYVDVNSGVAVTAITINEVGNRAYIGANSSSSYNELFIIDVTSKIGNRPIIGSYEATGMSVRDIAIVDDDTKAIIVGSNGEEYQVVDLTNEANPFKCGGLNVPAGVNGIAAVKFTDSGNAYSYVVTNESSAELRVIKGGEGGGGVDGLGYISAAGFTSQIYDTGSDNTRYYQASWSEVLPAGTDITVQVRSSDSPTMTGAEWYGPSGLLSYFADSPGEATPAELNGGRYFQYRVFLTTSNPINTPIFEDFQLLYED